MLRKLLAVVGLGLTVGVMCPLSAHAIVKEEQEDPIERCKRKCEQEFNERSAKCRKKRTPKDREKCWRESEEKYAKCLADCDWK